MSDHKPNNMPMFLTLGGIALVVAGYFYFQSAQLEKEAVASVKKFISSNPVNMMIIKDRPEAGARFMAHYRAAYDAGGEKAMQAAQMDMQQIQNINFLPDYIWYVEDKPLRNYLQFEYAFLKKLMDLDDAKIAAIAASKKNPRGPMPKMCEAYIANPANYAAASTAAGAELFIGYMKSSKRLFLSAVPKKLYPMWPGVSVYKDAVKMSYNSVTAVALRIYPELDLRGINKKQTSCQAYLSVLYATIKQDDPTMSLMWRWSMEGRRLEVEKLKKDAAAAAMLAKPAAK